MTYFLLEGLAANVSPFFSPRAQLRPTFAMNHLFFGWTGFIPGRRPSRKFSSARCECDLTHANFSLYSVFR